MRIILHSLHSLLLLCPESAGEQSWSNQQSRAKEITGNEAAARATRRHSGLNCDRSQMCPGLPSYRTNKWSLLLKLAWVGFLIYLQQKQFWLAHMLKFSQLKCEVKNVWWQLHHNLISVVLKYKHHRRDIGRGCTKTDKCGCRLFVANRCSSL